MTKKIESQNFTAYDVDAESKIVITDDSKLESPTEVEPDDSKIESPTATTDDTTETPTEEPTVGLGYSKIRVPNHSRACHH